MSDMAVFIFAAFSLGFLAGMRVDRAIYNHFNPRACAPKETK